MALKPDIPQRRLNKNFFSTAPEGIKIRPFGEDFVLSGALLSEDTK